MYDTFLKALVLSLYYVAEHLVRDALRWSGRKTSVGNKFKICEAIVLSAARFFTRRSTATLSHLVIL